MRYCGRFAPSPTGPLHAGSVVAALGSWLDARWHGGSWWVRIEDLDAPRCVPGAEAFILWQLRALGMWPDAPPWRQSQRGDVYAAALRQLVESGRAFPCACTRAQLAQAQGPRERHAERPYPGTCRQGLGGKPARAWRLRVPDGVVPWHDRRLGDQAQDVAVDVGDFVLRRADGLWAYQLAVVVDDAAQGVTDVVRGEDLADNTPRQIVLQSALGLSVPRYLHVPLVRAEDGHKLSKQNGAQAVDVQDPLRVLQAAGCALGLPALEADGIPGWLTQAVAAWGHTFGDVRCKGRQSAALPQLENPTMQTTPSGLQFEDTVLGTGATAEAGRTVRVHYTGWLWNEGQKGAKFDSSKDRGQPFHFHLGGGEVIRGWDEGVQGMQEGGTRVLIIPADLGYGARGAGGVIPPNATLCFEVDLLKA